MEGTCTIGALGVYIVQLDARGVGRKFSMGGGAGVVLNVIFKNILFALISSLTLYQFI